MKEYKNKGLESIKEVRFNKPQSKLMEHKSTLEDYLKANPQRSLKEAAHNIKQLTGIESSLPQVRNFLRSIGIKCRKTGSIPAKADEQKQTEFHDNVLEPLLEEAKAGKQIVYFVDAAHFVHSLYTAILWCFHRVFLKAPSGRQRFNVLGALNAITHELVTITNKTYINANSVCELLKKLATININVPITIILDNAKYQKCDIVT